MTGKAWGGRFQEATDARVEKFTESISFDARLADCDITGSQAHATMLAKVGLITDSERDQIVTELENIRGEIARGEMPYRTELEDIHMHIESRLTQRLGDIGRKLHTGRSRNDQVTTDLKLYVRGAIEHVDALLLEVQRAFVGRADHDREIVLPGYTHLQRAMPVLASHYWLAYCEKFDRDRQRLADCLKRVNVCPLGAAALAGTSLPIDRHETARLLGFTDVARNSIDVSSDRDYLVEFVFSLSLVSAHLSTLAEEWIIWFTTEFGFLKLPDKFTTGSSIMPQKRNPDAAELSRAKVGRIAGAFQALVMVMKGLPLAYSKDMQEDKEPTFDALKSLKLALAAMTGMVADLEPVPDAMRAAAGRGYATATDLADWLVRELKMPFRDAHHVTGSIVREAEKRGLDLEKLPLSVLQGIEPRISNDVYSVLSVENSVKSRKSHGGTAPQNVAKSARVWLKRLEKERGTG